MKKVLFVASEVAPYAKSGGLADVAGALPKELLKMGYDISVIMPRYREVKEEMEYVTDYPIYIHSNFAECIFWFYEFCSLRCGNRWIRICISKEISLS